VVDCLTLWLTNWLMPAQPSENGARMGGQCTAFLKRLQAAPGPVILVGNDRSGRDPHGARGARLCRCAGLAQPAGGAHCESVTLMCAGLPLALKGPQP
jgi:adenosylcobinamide kinase/adenosylcobinamide-phosphate guanylyltransferase